MPLQPPSKGIAAALLLVSAAASTAAAVSAPGAGSGPASYRVEALTSAGMGVQTSGTAMMQMLMGGNTPPVTRSLELTLRSARPAPPAPQAEHRIPAGLGLGSALPLRTPKPSADRPEPGSDDPSHETVQGRLLIFRGCAESAAAGQPQVIDLASLLPDQRWQAQALAAQKRKRPGLRSAAAAAVTPAVTIGTWPASDAGSNSGDRLPASASLVGDHLVQSNYAPEIRFQVTPSHDFLAPVQLQSRSVGDAMELSWSPIATSLGYQATVTGPGEKEGDLVIWTSSTAAWPSHPVPADLDAATARKLVDQGVLLPPSQTRCSISAKVMKQMGTGFLNFQAFGDTLKVAGPAWSVTLQRQSILLRPLMAMPMGPESSDSQDPNDSEAPRKEANPQRGGGFGWIPGLF